MALGSLTLLGVSGAWLLISRPAAAQVPEFIFIQAGNLPPPSAVELEPGPDTILTLSAVVQQLGTRASMRDSVLLGAKPAAQSSSSVLLQAKSMAQIGPSVVDSALDTRPLSDPAPAPAFLTAPLPPTPASPAPAPPARDPAVERSRAAGTLSEAAGALVRAINAREMPSCPPFFPGHLPGDSGQRTDLLKLVSDFSPQATLGSIEEVALSGDRAEARFTIALAWRGDFGVSRTMVSRFLGLVHRQEIGWRFDGARLLAGGGTTASQHAVTAALTPNPGLANSPPVRTSSLEATQAMAAAAGHLVAAINGQQVADLSRLLPETLAGDRGRRDRFLKLINQFSPQAELGKIEEVTVAEGRGEARFSVELSWRGDFGVVRRKAGQFLGNMRRQGNDWQFAGAQLLTAIP